MMSATVTMKRDATLFVARWQEGITKSEADLRSAPVHNRAVLSHDELVAELRRRRDAGEFTNADMARVLGLPTSRIADIFTTDRTPRQISVNEMKTLVEHYGLAEPAVPVPASLARKWKEASEKRRKAAEQMLTLWLEAAENE